MCGLAGIFDSRSGGEISERLLSAMRDRLVHRGPDGFGNHLAPGIGLAHRRLAIVDLGGGHQPLYNEDGQVVVVFNGEIYNFQSLVRELEQAGHTFRTRSDTEVIVHGWEQWGPDCVRRFHGMFAFALWDARSETLFLARDRLGKKPLYYTLLHDGRLLFASELKALLVCPETSRRIDPLAIEDYLAFGYVPEPRSIYLGVEKLPPAHRMVWRRGGQPRIDAYWQLRLGRDDCADESACGEELHARFRQAVAERLMADVPLGAFLSGGVDSSGVVALMAGLVDEPINTFCISFGEPAFDESAYAQVVARRYATNHLTRRADPDDLSMIDRLAGVFDEPFGDCSALPTYRVCALARERVKVALSGDGGDEVFAGYRRYRWHVREERVRSLLPGCVRRPLFGLLGNVYPKLDQAPRWLRAKTTFQELAQDPVEAYGNSVSVISEPLRQSLYTPAMRRALQGYRAVDVLRRHMDEADTDEPLQKAQYADIKTWLPGDILVKVDRTSMAVALEVRAPLLNHELVEWGCSLPAGLKVRQQQGKYLLKRSLEPLVPNDLLYRPKQGFSSPLAVWFRGPLLERMIGAAQRLGGWGYLDGGRTRRLIDDHTSGKRDHGPVLWSLLMLDAFLQHQATL
jgi:asparagine synthase (glutamine-hydrolysing)